MGCSANAQSFEEALAKFTTDSFIDTDEAISGVAASGNPLAIRVIEALQEGRLLFSAEQKKVIIREASRSLLDAATGIPSLATRHPISSLSASTIGCAARSMPRSAA